MKDQRPDDEIYLMDYLRTLWKRKLMIIFMAAAAVSATSIYSMFLKDVYQASAVISPVSDKGPGEGLATMAQQFGGIVGISLPNSASSSEIVNLLKSNVLREKVVRKYNLFPVLFPAQRDAGKKAWKTEDMARLTLKLSSASMKASDAFGSGERTSQPGEEGGAGAPTMWDALRMLESIVAVKNNSSSNTITVSAEFHNPEMASAIVNYFLAALVEHMSEESKKVANANARYLENLLRTTADPIIRQKVYNLLAQQIEISMMAEMKENFAFKIIDPSRPPDIKIRPKKKQMVFLSLVISLFAGIFLALFAEYVKGYGKGEGVSDRNG
ncbi:MAG: hypothetical protein HY891_08800 [Deltaproteobacteria bacterium]|nr:hypothetical protein [Deltaproteobacteria bacterium]